MTETPKRARFLILALATLTVSLAMTPGLADELSAREVMERADQLDDGDSFVADYTMVLIDRRDRQRSRGLTIYSLDYDDGTRILGRFSSPADISGTSYLNYDWTDPDRDDDSWLYLPAVQRVRRIASSDTSDSFMGSDFTYADINGIEVGWFDYHFIDTDAEVDGHAAWHIEATPKPEYKDKAEDSTGYSHFQAWIRKDNFVQLRSQAWELRGNRIKYFTAADIHQVDGIWTVGRRQAVTTRGGRQQHASVLQLSEIRYNVDVEEDLFTTEAMQRGGN